MKTILFKQNNCRPCDTVKTVMELDLEVTADLTINLSNGDVYTADGELNSDIDGFDLAGEYGVMSTPVLILTGEKDGKANEVIRELRGLMTRDDIKDIFEQRGLI